VNGYGWADVSQEIAMEPDTVFPVTSLSTMVSAWGAMTLVESGSLDLDSPVNKYLTSLQLASDEYDPSGITVRRILSHTSGLSVTGYEGMAAGEALPAVRELISGEVEGVEGVQLLETPGSRWRYSAGGYAVLELLMEDITGQAFPDSMKQQVLQPLQMTSSSFNLEPELEERLAVGYDAAQAALDPVRYPAGAASGLYSTAGDIAAFLSASMEGAAGRAVGSGVLDAEMAVLMLQPAAGTWSAFQFGERGNAGLGYALYTLENETELVLQFGGGSGFRSMAAMAPDRGEGLVVLANSERGEEFSMRLLCAWSAWATENVPEMCTRIQ